MKSYKIGVVQSSFKLLEVEQNLKKIESIVDSYKKKIPNIQLLLFPELAVTGYFLEPSLSEVAETADGPSFKRLSSLAKKNKIYLAYGFVEQGESGERFNSVQLIGPSGESLANYRKIHLTPTEKAFFQAGSEVVKVKTELGTIGLMICWDLAFPELARLLALKGSDLLLVPSAWEDPYSQPFLHFGMARAIDNTVFLASCNHIGQSGNLTFFGQSSIYGPDGEVILSADAYKEEVITAEVSVNQRKEIQESFFTMLGERRTDIY